MYKSFVEFFFTIVATVILSTCINMNVRRFILCDILSPFLLHNILSNIEVRVLRFIQEYSLNFDHFKIKIVGLVPSFDN